MSGFVEGIDRSQSSLFPAALEDYVAEDNLVRAVDAFVEGLDLGKLGFGRFVPLERGRPCYHPATLLKIYIYGYLNRVPSSRRLERECQRNIELIWLTGHLAPDFKTIADFRKDNGKAIREVCRAFVALCRELDLLSEASVAIDGSKFKAVNARDKNFTEAKMKRRLERIEESIARYIAQLETADRRGDAMPEAKVAQFKDKIAAAQQFGRRHSFAPAFAAQVGGNSSDENIGLVQRCLALDTELPAGWIETRPQYACSKGLHQVRRQRWHTGHYVAQFILARNRERFNNCRHDRSGQLGLKYRLGL